MRRDSAQATALGARAFASGDEVHVATGHWAPDTSRGLALLGHEVAHLGQQRLGQARPTAALRGALVSHDAALEAQADAAGARAASWTGGPPIEPALGAALARPAGAQAVVQGNGIPFPFRYAQSGSNYMSTVTSGSGGLVHYPSTGLPQPKGTESSQVSVASGVSFGDMPTGHKRAVQQSAVMDNVSPNAAASALGLECPTSTSWEWLHLVAFSIKETHVSSLKAQSMQLMKRTHQPQQIQENLVLGTAAANTAMLTYETVIKQIMKANPDWTLALYVAAHVERPTVRNPRGQSVQIPVCTRIDYHFYFTTGDGRVVPPVILAFNTLSHDKPTKSEYSEVSDALKAHIKQALAVKQPVQGINTSILKPV